MNKYVKPEFILASLGVTALAASQCKYALKEQEINDLYFVFGEGAFFEDGGCNNNPVEGYCNQLLGDSGDLTGAFAS